MTGRAPLLWVLLPLAAGICMGDAWPWDGYFIGCLIILAMMGLAGLLRLHPLLFCLLLPACFLLFGATLATGRRPCGVPSPQTPRTCTALLLSDPHPTAHNLRFEARLDEGRYLLYIRKEGRADSLQRGDSLQFTAALRPVPSWGDSLRFHYPRYARHHGVSGVAFLYPDTWHKLGHHLPRTFAEKALARRDSLLQCYRTWGIEGQRLALLAALTVGYRQLLELETKSHFAQTGTSHVLALSGLHIGILCGTCWLLMLPLLRRFRVLRFPFGLCMAAGLWGFAYLTGFSPSVVRSVTFFSLMALAAWRPPATITVNTLAATAFLMLLVNPYWLFDVGFQLSFAAVASILCIHPLLQPLWHPAHRATRYAWSLITVTLAAQAGTLPLVLYYFGTFSPWFLAGSLWAIPLVTLILCTVLLLLCLSLFGALHTHLVPLLNLLLDAQPWGLRQLQRLPLSSLEECYISGFEVVLLYLCLASLVCCIRRTDFPRLATLLLLLMAMGWVHFFG